MLYENMYIGAFVYALGVMAGKTSTHINDSVNLFQQTPNDKTFNDLLMSWQGKNFLIEFKKDQKGLKSEVKKETRIKLLQTLSRPNAESLKKISMRCHFMGYGVGDTEITTLYFQRYIQFENAKEPTIKLQEYINFLRDPNSDYGTTDIKLFQLYLKLLLQITQGQPASGIIVNVSANKPPKCISFSSFEDLRITLSVAQNLTINQKSISKKINNQLGR